LRPSSAGYCIVFLVLFGNVARGAVRYSRRLRSRPLQPFLSGLLFGFQSHASYLFQKLAIAMDQPCCSTADHASLPQETASKDCATLAWSAMRPSSGWNTGSLTKRVNLRRDQAMGRTRQHWERGQCRPADIGDLEARCFGSTQTARLSNASVTNWPRARASRRRPASSASVVAQFSGSRGRWLRE
jgi:hypothetical protein